MIKSKIIDMHLGRSVGSQENGKRKKGEVDGDIEAKRASCLQTETGLAPVPPLGVVAEFSC